MTITCPHCGFSRQTDPERVPAGPVRITCPQCRQRFSLQPEENEPGSPAPEIGTAPEQPAPPGIPAPGAPSAAATESEPTASPVSAAGLPKAGFWIRFIAAVVDSVLVTVVQVILSFGLGLAAGALGALGGNDGAMAFTTWLFGTVLAIAYYVVFTGHGGQTPGKMAVRVKVIRTDGSEIGYGRAALREVPGKFVSGILFGIGYLMVAFDPQKQGLHDKIADTYVIKL